MRDGKWKFVTLPDGGLYDLSVDLAEQNDLSKQFPERAEEMKHAIEMWKKDVATGATQQSGLPPDIKVANPPKQTKQRRNRKQRKKK